ncbi:MAG: sigma-70 family RNA polymerase sigma factor [Pseudomonadota bacterium]
MRGAPHGVEINLNADAAKQATADAHAAADRSSVDGASVDSASIDGAKGELSIDIPPALKRGAKTANGSANDAADAQKQHFADLAARVANNRDKQAFAELFHHFAPRVNAFLIRLNLDNGSAEEMTQEIMVTLWNKAHMFDPTKSSLPTWIFRIARNRRIDAVRRQKTAQLDPHDPMLLPSEPEQPDAGMDAVTREARVREALAGLPEDQVKLIKLAFFTGLSHSQIAKETGLPLGTVKSRIRLAFNRLRGVLEALPEIDVAE